MQVLQLNCTLGDSVTNSTRTPVASATQRSTARQRVALPARLTWKDQAGAVRFASVTTRDLSDTGAFVECSGAAPLPLFRLVHLQLEQAAAGADHPLAAGRVLAAVWRVEGARDSGPAQGYALRFMVDPTQAPATASPRFAVRDMAAAS